MLVKNAEFSRTLLIEKVNLELVKHDVNDVFDLIRVYCAKDPFKEILKNLLRILNNQFSSWKF